MLAPPVALRRILAALADTAPLPPERVPLAEAVGRALAEDVRSPGALPAFDASTMDGYALRARDARAAGARLPVAYEVFAGRPAPGPLPPGACCRIYTGAPLPRGADAVEQQEQVRRSGRLALFLRPAEAGRFVRPAGSDVRAGSAPLRAGAVLDPGSVGLAAALGRTDALVRRRPRVAILPTGDELVPAGRRPGPGQIVESNGRALAAAAREAGAEA
ncbi:MAG TPA: molybdopterin molybdenumtransferase MoeA, partial [Anaeromyxobacteraceae bacterium]|nr:molybdopterin molybdenumtransferase MoeA [Anaeromyxobacteraceae bacterium]